MAVSGRLPAVLQPVVGALSGLCGWGLIVILPQGPGAVAALLLWTAVTLGEGERGFANWFPRLPLFGTLLAGCTILVRWYALISLQTSSRRLAVGIVAAMTLGPAASVALAWVSRPVDDGALRRLSVLTTPTALIGIGEGVVAALLCGPRIGVVLALVAWLLIRLVSYVAQWRFRGVRGQDLDAFRVVVETVALVVIASLREL
jgi:cobalamin synthase